MSSFSLQHWFPMQQQRVEELLKLRLAAVGRDSPPQLMDAMRYSLLGGGKRLRPVLCLAFSEAISRASNGGGELASDAACAVEFVHTYSLIHDDLPAMDDDDFRRGQPTSHKAFGEAMAILAGDALLTGAFSLLGGAGEQSVRSRLVMELAAAAGAGGMVGGQVLDVSENRSATLDYLLKMHRLKTGALIKAACRMGALCVGADARALEAAEVYGDSVGLAFQIADDILDATASAQTMGKPTGADAAAGRHTFPAVIGLDSSRALALEHVGRALSAVRDIEDDDGPLAALARYSVERSN